MTREDEIEFLDFVRTTGDVILIPETSELLLSEVYRYFFELEGRKCGEGCHLWNRSISPEPIVAFYPGPNYYCVNSLQSEVLNPMRSKMCEGLLSMGRLHVEHQVLVSGNTLGQKSKAFIDWYDKVCRWIRTHYKHRFDGAYASERVREEVEKGLKLTGHCF